MKNSNLSVVILVALATVASMTGFVAGALSANSPAIAAILAVAGVSAPLLASLVVQHRIEKAGGVVGQLQDLAGLTDVEADAIGDVLARIQGRATKEMLANLPQTLADLEAAARNGHAAPEKTERVTSDVGIR